MVSDLATVARIEKRRQAAYPENENYAGMLALVHRYKCVVKNFHDVGDYLSFFFFCHLLIRFLDLIPCSTAELESFARPDDRRLRTGGRDLTGVGGKEIARPDLSQLVRSTSQCSNLSSHRSTTTTIDFIQT